MHNYRKISHNKKKPRAEFKIQQLEGGTRWQRTLLTGFANQYLYTFLGEFLNTIIGH